MKIGFITLLLTALSQLAFAQRFEQGYYIKNSGDTIKTEIFLQQRAGSITSVVLRDNTSFKPIEIRGAGIGGVNYVTRVLSVDKSPKLKDPVMDTVILEVMERGKISLLYHLDEYEKTHYHLEKEDGSLEELGMKILDKGTGIHFQKLTTYKDVLKKNFATCTNLFPIIDKTTYLKKNVDKTFQKLYECAHGKLTRQIATKEIVNEFGLTGGVSMTNYNFTGLSVDARVAKFDFGTSTNFTGGLFYDFKFARTGKLFTLRNELIYRSYASSSKEVAESKLIQNQKFSTAFLSTAYLKYNIILRHSFGYGKVRPFANVGFSIAYLLSYNEHVYVKPAAFGVSGTPYEESLLGSASPIDFGISAGGGVKLGNFSFEGRYEYGFGTRPKEAVASPVNTIYFLGSYCLWQSVKKKGS